MMASSPKSWPDVKCFQHCDRDVNIICCSVPPACPLCGADTGTTLMRIPPYILPSPFVLSTKTPCSIVVRPTLGDFISFAASWAVGDTRGMLTEFSPLGLSAAVVMSNYSNTVDLHIGLTDSKGGVYDFDEEGLHTGSTWSQCVAVSVGGSVDHVADWDRRLARFADTTFWSPHRYNEHSCNCFDFVIQFLRRHCMFEREALGMESVTGKETFCEHFLKQRMKKIAQYVHLYRTVLKQGCALEPVKP